MFLRDEGLLPPIELSDDETLEVVLSRDKDDEYKAKLEVVISTYIEFNDGFEFRRK